VCETIDAKIERKTFSGAVALKKLGISMGVATVAILALAYVYSSGPPQEGQLAPEPEPFVSQDAAAASPAPVQDADERLESAVTKKSYTKDASKTRGLLVTQDRTGTECKTPSGLVCTVEPGRINSPCTCGGENGLIIR
jgi:hypothetical protein